MTDLTVKDVEKLVGRSYPTVRRWVVERGFPEGIGDDGKAKLYDRDAVLGWMRENLADPSRPQSAVVLSLGEALAAAAAADAKFDRTDIEAMLASALRKAMRRDKSVNLRDVKIIEGGIHCFFDADDDSSRVLFLLKHRGRT